MTEHKEGHRKSAAHSARHLARVFVMLGLYQWLADPSQDYAGIEAHLSSLLHDEEAAARRQRHPSDGLREGRSRALHEAARRRA